MKLNKEAENEIIKYPPPEKLKAFTLSEVLITLAIIGVIAAITVPSLLQSSQEKELHSMLKKNFSVIENALRLAQINEGLLGDNTAVFTPSSDSNASYESAKRFAKYLNTMKVCKDSKDPDCDGIYYNINYATKKEGSTYKTDASAVVLTDGSIYKILQYENCLGIVNDCEQDSEGNCLKDEGGNEISQDWTRKNCADLYVDVNGVKPPNKMGKDVFAFKVYQDKLSLSSWAPNASEKQKNILLNKI